MKPKNSLPSSTQRSDTKDAVPQARTAPGHAGQIRILVVDDHAVVREGLQMVLQAQPDITVLGMAADGQEGVELACQLEPQIVIMDISMPRLNGIEATRQIIAARPQTRVIGLSMHNDPEMIAEMHTAGAVLCLSKNQDLSHLLAAIRKQAAA